MRVQPFERVHLPQLLKLVNLHLAAVVPGWAITEEFLAETLERNHTEYITDPWVEERATLCAAEGHRVLAAAHLLRYGTGPEVSDSYKGTGEIDWFLSLPGRSDAASAVLSSARDHLASWEVSQEYGWGGGIPAGPPLWGVPDIWPHIAAALDAAGYKSPPGRHREAIYGGTLGGVPQAGGGTHRQPRTPAGCRALRHAVRGHPRWPGVGLLRGRTGPHPRRSSASVARLGRPLGDTGTGGLAQPGYRRLALAARRPLAPALRLRPYRRQRRRSRRSSRRWPVLPALGLGGVRQGDPTVETRNTSRDNQASRTITASASARFPRFTLLAPNTP